MTANWKITLAILTANTVLMSASYTMLIPFLPMYLIQELGVAQGDVNWWSSAIFSVTFLISGIMAPIWGAIADKKSRKLMAIRAAACLAITYTLGGLVQGPWQLFWVRVLQGLSAGLWPATLAIMSAHAPHNRLGFSMGVMQAGLTAGGVLGPLIGGLLAEYIGMRSTFLASGAALFLITLVLAFCVTDSPAGKKSAAAKETADAAATRPNPLRLAVVQRMLLPQALCSSRFS